MKIVITLISFLAMACAGSQPTGDPWQGMTPAEYADSAWSRPVSEKQAVINQAETVDAFMILLDVAAGAASGYAVNGGFWIK